MKHCKCGKPRDREPNRYCLSCHAEYMRKWRESNKLTDDQRKKDNCRSYAGVYKRRGKLKQTNCEKCDSPNSQMHHDDYDKPLTVRWLCKKCHLALHKLVAAP